MGLPLLETEIEDECPGDFDFVVAVCLRDGSALYVRHPKRGWEFPGGKLEGDEGFVEACVREVREESGLRVEDAVEVAEMRDVFRDGVMEGRAVACRAEGEAEPGHGMQEAEWFREPPRDLSFPEDLYVDLLELARSALHPE